MAKELKRKGRFNESVGNIIKWEQTLHGITVEAENALAEISFYDPRIVRVRITRKEEAEETHSYAVVMDPDAVDPDSLGLKIWEEDGIIRLKSPKLIVEVDMTPMRVRFGDRFGRLLNEDDHAFGTSWIGNEVTTYKKLQKGERFIGMGEKTGNLDRRGNSYVHWNTDHFAYSGEDDPIYLSTPFYLGVLDETSKAGDDHVCYGIFFDNTHKSLFNFGASNHRFASFGAEDGDMNYYFIHDLNISGILEAYSKLTGKMPLPPKWSLGYQQCRYSYYPESEVLTTARTFREKGFPADVIYLDIHYMDAYKVFTFHPERFPDPKGMAKELEEMGFHLALILDPGVKTEKGYKPYDEGLEKEYYATYPDGEPWEADVWPGTSAFPDFTRPEVREWWGDWTKFYTELGVTGFWNDMNEPATWGQTTPDLVEFGFEGEGATHKKARNVYGMQMARSTYEGVKKHMNGQRPFILTRAGFSGIQRYAAAWTGDNIASDEHMLLGVRLVNSLGLAGIPFAGPDVGGFVGSASEALCARWMQVGAFTPFFRGHSMVNSRDAEPWSFGEEVEEINRNYIRLRYRMMPYFYSLFREASLTGMPVARSLAIEWPHDELVYDSKYQNQFMLGESLMVCPVESHRDMVKVYLPGNKGEHWRDFYTGNWFPAGLEYYIDTPIEKMPLFVREGSILPMQSQVLSLSETPEDILHLHMYPWERGSTLRFYDDDGKTYDFESGKYYAREISLSFTDGSAEHDYEVSFGEAEGTFDPVFKTARIYLHGFEKEQVDGLKVKNGENLIDHAIGSVEHMVPITAFDPFGGEREYGKTDNVVIFDLPLDRKAFSVQIYPVGLTSV